MSDCQIIALALTVEFIEIDSENYFFGKLKSDSASDFPGLIDRFNFNRRCKRLYPKIAEPNLVWQTYSTKEKILKSMTLFLFPTAR